MIIAIMIAAGGGSGSYTPSHGIYVNNGGGFHDDDGGGFDGDDDGR